METCRISGVTGSRCAVGGQLTTTSEMAVSMSAPRLTVANADIGIQTNE
jgi:hypothetical protein